MKTREITTTKEFQNYKAYFFKQIGYAPHKFQREMHLSKVRYKVFVAGARGGKSMAAGYDVAPYMIIPDYRCWCVGTTYDLADKEYFWCLDALSKFKFRGKPLTQWAKISNSARGSRQCSFPWGAFIKTKSAVKLDTLLGEELDRVIVSESAQMACEPWDRYLRARLGPREGDAIFPTTGAGDFGLLPACMERCKKDKDWVLWQFKTKDNPTFSRAEYERARKELSKEVFAEQYEGKLISRRGSVFRSFGNEHIINELPSDFEFWPRAVGVMRGFNNPLALVWVAYNHDKKEYIAYDEFYKRETLIEEVAPRIEKANDGVNVIGTFSELRDPACKRALEQVGIAPTQLEEEKSLSEKFAIIKRVQHLQNLLKIREDKPPRLRILSTCENLINEFKKCKWPDRKKEDAEMSELETPLTKFFQAIRALSIPVAFCENISGGDIYGCQ